MKWQQLEEKRDGVPFKMLAVVIEFNLGEYQLNDGSFFCPSMRPQDGKSTSLGARLCQEPAAAINGDDHKTHGSSMCVCVWVSEWETIRLSLCLRF